MISTFSAPSRAVQEHSIWRKEGKGVHPALLLWQHNLVLFHVRIIPHRLPNSCYNRPIYTNVWYQRGNALRGCSGSHLLIVVGCAVERGSLMCEVRNNILERWVRHRRECVQGGLIHWAHPEKVVAEQASGRGWSRFTPQIQINYVYMHIHTYFTVDKVYTYTLAWIKVQILKVNVSTMSK